MGSTHLLLWLASVTYFFLSHNIVGEIPHADVWCHCHMVFHCVTQFLYPSALLTVFWIVSRCVVSVAVDISIGAAKNFTCEWNSKLTSVHLFIRISKCLSKVHLHIFTPTRSVWSACCSTSPPTFGPTSQFFKFFYDILLKSLPMCWATKNV